MFDCRLIFDSPGSGPWNLAVDEALLVDAAENGVGSLRFYEWSEPTLSLGYFQRFEDRSQHLTSRECTCVRRQSGGGAILHDRELTYSVALPADHPLVRRAEQLYLAVHEAVVAALAPRVAAAASSWALQLRCGATNVRLSDEPFLCFERQAYGDLLLVAPGATASESTTWKILGSAQRRHRGAILQHGSLLMQTSPAAPELPGLCDLTGLAFSAGVIAESLGVLLERVLNVRFAESLSSPGLESKAAELANIKYGSSSWTKRR